MPRFPLAVISSAEVVIDAQPIGSAARKTENELIQAMHPVQVRVRAIANQARSLVWGRALALWLCGVMLVAFSVGVSDYLFRFREMPLRWFCFCTALSGAAASWYKWVRPVIGNRWSDLQVAELIEQREPKLHGQLSSALAFLQTPRDDARYGSPLLRAEVVRRATVLAVESPLGDLLDPRPARRAALTLLAVALLCGSICLLDADAARFAARRLVMPWSSEAWPRMQQLAFIKPPAILAYGQDFAVELIDEQDRLPEEVQILYWFEGDDASPVGAHRMTFAGGKMIHRLAGVTRSFRYRARGGDDTEMPWHSLQVVVPPRVVTSRITLRPPAYTGRTVETAERRIRAIAGTTAEVAVQLDQPVRTAALRFQSGKEEVAFPAVLTQGGRSAAVPAPGGQAWTLTTSGTYSWQFIGRNGMNVAVDENTEVDVLPDLPPVVSLEFPTSEASFTARAVIPMRIRVQDDLAVHRVTFHSGDAMKRLAEFPPIRTATAPNLPAGDSPRIIEFTWDLSEIADLKDGSTVPFEIVATDFKPQGSLPASGTIRVLSALEFEQRVERAQISLLQRLKEALGMQRNVHQQTQSLATQLAANGRLSDADGAVWPALESAQRRVTEYLAGDEGAATLVERLLHDLSVNRWDAAQLVSHLNSVRQEIRRVSESLLPPIQQLLSQADRGLRFEPPDYASVQQAWSNAAVGQEPALAALESLVDQLGEWDRYRNLAQEVKQLIEEHASVTEATRSLPTAGRDVSQLAADERAQLVRLAQRLQDAAAQVDRLQSRLDQLRQRLDESNPEAAKSLHGALQVLDREPISGGIREAARALTNNRIGDAARELDATRGGLKQLLDALEQQPSQEPHVWELLLSQAVRDWSARQEAVIQNTTDLQRQTADANAVERATRELSHTQSTLAQEVKKLASEALPQAASYSLALELVARPMSQAGERLARILLDERTLQLEREAFNFLKTLADSLGEPPPQPPAPTGTEQPPPGGESPTQAAQLTLAELKLMRLVQLELLRRTFELEQNRGADGHWSELQIREMEELADRQLRLADRLAAASAPPLDENAGSGSPDPARAATRTPGDPSSMHAKPASSVPGSELGSNLGRELDRELLDDVPRQPNRSPAGEDLGQPTNEASPVAALERRFREIDTRLRDRDVSGMTQQLQRHAAEQLTTMIEELQQRPPVPGQPSPAEPSPTPPQPSLPASAGSQPGSGTGGTAAAPGAESHWSRGVWGVLPDRVRQQIQNLSDEEFLPEYENLIRRYYDRLSKRGHSATSTSTSRSQN